MDNSEIEAHYRREFSQVGMDALGGDIETIFDYAERVSKYQGQEFSTQALLGQISVSEGKFYLHYDIYNQTPDCVIKSEVNIMPYGNNRYLMSLRSDEQNSKYGDVFVAKNQDGHYEIEEENLGPYDLIDMMRAIRPAKGRYTKIVEHLGL